MTWFLAVVVVLLLGGIALVASGRGAPMVDEYDDRPDALVPGDTDLGPRDLRRVRFSLALRGYRMSEVDALLDRLARQLEDAEPPADLSTAPPLDAAADPSAGSEGRGDGPRP